MKSLSDSTTITEKDFTKALEDAYNAPHTDPILVCYMCLSRPWTTKYVGVLLCDRCLERVEKCLQDGKDLDKP